MKKIKLNFADKDNTNILLETVKTLKNGGLVIFPSDTVYGLLVDSTNEKAVKKLIQFKSRPVGKPISIFVSDFDMMKKFVDVDNQKEKLLNELLPGPFTVVLDSKYQTSKLLESEKGSLGVRIPDFNPIIKLISLFGKPTSATSANLSGRSPHYGIRSLMKDLPESKKKLIDLIIDAGELPHRKPSTVMDLTKPTITILRDGDIVMKEIDIFISESPIQTQEIGKYIVKKYLKNIKDKPLVFIIEGDLGVGKTVLVKGIGQLLGINKIVSPTYVIYYEYDSTLITVKKLYHFDLYNIEEKNEFKYLGFEKLLNPHVVMCIEWGEKAGEMYEKLKKKSFIVHINMKYISEIKREIIIKLPQI
ncbi:MAG: L-threonylcarbamoyladenylate synthase [bacterium]|nr:L-threonylcarbamoyladenylate synthase [bacterium]